MFAVRRRGRPRHPDVLTPREWEVLGLVREGMTNEQIAERLQISVRGVKFHVSEIIGKLGVADRHEAARWNSGGESAPAVALALRRATWPVVPGVVSSGAILVTVAAVALLA